MDWERSCAATCDWTNWVWRCGVVGIGVGGRASGHASARAVEMLHAPCLGFVCVRAIVLRFLMGSEGVHTGEPDHCLMYGLEVFPDRGESDMGSVNSCKSRGEFLADVFKGGGSRCVTQVVLDPADGGPNAAEPEGSFISGNVPLA